MEPLILVGASSLARETLAAVRAQGTFTPIGFVDDNEARWGSSVNGLPVFGSIPAVLEYPDARLVICVRNGQSRSRLATRLRMLGVDDRRYAIVMHPSVDVPANCRVGHGSILLAGVAMTAEVYLGRHVVVMPNVTLLHASRVQSFTTIGAGSAIGPGARLGEESTIGMNSSVRDRVTLGRRVEVGIGSVLLKDLPAGAIWPAPMALRHSADARRPTTSPAHSASAHTTPTHTIPAHTTPTHTIPTHANPNPATSHPRMEEANV